MSIKIKIFLLIGIFQYKQILATIPITLNADPTEACVGCSVSFTVNSPCNLTGATFYWNFGDGSESITDTPFISHTYTDPGTFNVNVIVVKSRDSGGNDVIIKIYKLGSFAIDAERVFDVKENPLYFHIHAWKTVLKDTDDNDWNPIPKCLHVLYEWWNCFDGVFFSSGHTSEYTFTSIFMTPYLNSTAVKAHVYCECNDVCWLPSNTVIFYLTGKVSDQ